MKGWVALLVGLVTGILSGCGVGGGSLLMLYLTVIAHWEVGKAAVINLVYFLGCSLPAIRAHRQNGLIRGDVAGRCLPMGLIAAVAGSLLATVMHTAWLHRAFGVFLIYIGVRELWRKCGG